MQHYYGLPPEEGFSYGQYLCPSCGLQFISNRGQEMYCPVCATEVNFVQDVAESEIPSGIREVGKCTACTSILATSAPDVPNPVYCPQCGSTVDTSAEAVSQQNEPAPELAEDLGGEGSLSVAEFLSVPDEDVAGAPSEAEIVMTFHRCPKRGPFWNVIVNGQPMGRIYLQDQPAPQEIEPIFVSEQYPQMFRQAAAKFGLKQALASVNARLYAVDENKVRAHVEEEIRKQYEEKFQKRVLHLTDEFKEAVAIALEGMAKNFFQDVENPLKAALFNELVRAGVEEPTRYIEAAFERAAQPFFEKVLAKAFELMAKPEEVRAEIARLIKAAGPVPVQPAATAPQPSPATASAAEDIDTSELKQRLVKGNFILATPQSEATTASAHSPSDIKEALRGLFRRH